MIYEELRDHCWGDIDPDWFQPIDPDEQDPDHAALQKLMEKVVAQVAKGEKKPNKRKKKK